MEESLVNRKSELLATSRLNPAYGDQLIDLVAAPVMAEELKARASYLSGAWYESPASRGPCRQLLL
jgi:hypothetical protein